MAKIDAVTVFERMGPAMQSGLIVERGAALCFTHDVVRDALYESSPESFRRVLHLEAGKALLDAGGDMDVVAAHLVQASVTNDPRLVGVLRKAALRSGVRSTLTSVTLLRRAVDSSPPDDPRRDHLIGELVTALVSTGACEEARRRALAVLDRRPNSQTEALVRGALVVAALDAREREHHRQRTHQEHEGADRRERDVVDVVG